MASHLLTHCLQGLQLLRSQCHTFPICNFTKHYRHIQDPFHLACVPRSRLGDFQVATGPWFRHACLWNFPFQRYHYTTIKGLSTFSWWRDPRATSSRRANRTYINLGFRIWLYANVNILRTFVGFINGRSVRLWKASMFYVFSSLTYSLSLSWNFGFSPYLAFISPSTAGNWYVTFLSSIHCIIAS